MKVRREEAKRVDADAGVWGNGMIERGQCEPANEGQRRREGTGDKATAGRGGRWKVFWWRDALRERLRAGRAVWCAPWERHRGQAATTNAAQPRAECGLGGREDVITTHTLASDS